jgi:anti-sigma factor RsiW
MDFAVPESGHATAELLSAYLDRQVEAGEGDVVDAHLMTCKTCSAELAGLEALRTLLRALPEVQPPRSFMLPEPAAVVRFPRLLVWTRAAAAVAAAFFVMFLTVDLVDTNTGGAPSPAADSRAAPAPASAPVMAAPTLAIGNTTRRESEFAQAQLAATPRAAADSSADVGKLTSSPWRSVPTPVGTVGLSPLRIATIGTGALALALIVAALMLSRRDIPASTR